LQADRLVRAGYLSAYESGLKSMSPPSAEGILNPALEACQLEGDTGRRQTASGI
jgi:hypothetical protein